MKLEWWLGCDFGHRWSLETDASADVMGQVRAGEHACHEGHLAVYAGAYEPPFTPTISISSTQLVSRGAAAPKGVERFVVRLDDRRTGESFTSESSFTWRELRDVLERIHSQRFATAVELVELLAKTHTSSA